MSSPTTTPIHKRLNNGLRVVLCPVAHLKQAHVAVYFNVGSRHEDSAENGITHVLEHMLFRGTKAFRSAAELNAAAEAIGGYLEAATYRDHLEFSLSCHCDELPKAIDILSDMVQHPRYLALDTEREIIHEELLEALDDKGRVIDTDTLVHRQQFGSHGLGQPIEGTVSNLMSFDKAQLERFRTRHLVAKNAVVAVAGKMQPNKILSQLRRAFGSMAPGSESLSPAPAHGAGVPKIQLTRHPGSQVDVRLSFRGPVLEDPRYPAMVVLSRILSDGMSSRLHTDLVDKQGLAYALNAGSTTYTDCGLFDFEFAVAPDKVVDTTAAVLDFAKRACRFRYTEDEIQRACRRYRYELEFMEESSEDLAGWYGQAALFHMQSQLETLADKINRITANQLRDVATTIFSRSGLVFVAVGELKTDHKKGLRQTVESWQGPRNKA